MAHAIWSGSINFGLVTIPVKLLTAVRTNDLSFNMLHAKDEGRIKYETRATIRVIPEDADADGTGACVYDGQPATQRALFAQAY